MGPLRQLKTVFVHNIGQNRCHRDSLLFRVWGGTFFNARQVLSIVFVWVPVSGSTKFTEWFTVRWENPSLFREL